MGFQSNGNELSAEVKASNLSKGCCYMHWVGSVCAMRLTIVQSQMLHCTFSNCLFKLPVKHEIKHQYRRRSKHWAN